MGWGLVSTGKSRRNGVRVQGRGGVLLLGGAAVASVPTRPPAADDAVDEQVDGGLVGGRPYRGDRAASPEERTIARTSAPRLASCCSTVDPVLPVAPAHPQRASVVLPPVAWPVRPAQNPSSDDSSAAVLHVRVTRNSRRGYVGPLPSRP